MEEMLPTWGVPRSITESCPISGHPRTHHDSPQFHVKFDDFFETVWDKPTDLDAPEPEWKYLSGFAVRKGQNKAEVKGVMDCLLTPQRGQATAITCPSTP